MTTTIDIQNALANEARRQALSAKIASLQGQITATAQVVARLSVVNADANLGLSAAQAELTALNIDAGPGITSDFGPKSIIDQFLDAERAAAKSAVIDYIKANPACLQADAAASWTAAAIASHTSVSVCVQDPNGLFGLYSAQLASRALIPDTTWKSFAAWIVATSKATIMAS